MDESEERLSEMEDRQQTLITQSKQQRQNRLKTKMNRGSETYGTMAKELIISHQCPRRRKIKHRQKST